MKHLYLVPWLPVFGVAVLVLLLYEGQLSVRMWFVCMRNMLEEETR